MSSSPRPSRDGELSQTQSRGLNRAEHHNEFNQGRTKGKAQWDIKNGDNAFWGKLFFLPVTREVVA